MSDFTVSLGTSIPQEGSLAEPDLARDIAIPNGTFFSSLAFASAWVYAFPERDRLFPIRICGSGPPRLAYAIQQTLRFGTTSIAAGPYDDFCFSPGWEGELDPSVLEGMLQQFKTFRTRQFIWRVRFDHQPLEQGLKSLGLTARPREVHVVHLQKSYDEIRRGYSSSLRNQISKAYRRGLVVREAQDLEDLSAYQRIYRALADQKGWRFIYPLEFLVQLAKQSKIARFFVAQFEGRIVGGALFVRDGCSAMYVEGASDRSFTKLYPHAALVDRGIRWALDIGATFFNMGNAGTNLSLAAFKSFFGSRKEVDWDFEWRNPLLENAALVKRTVASGMRRVLPTHKADSSTSVPSKPTPRNSQMSWSERASFDELSAGLYAGGPERENLLLHAATLTGAKRVSKFNSTRDQRPVLMDFGCGNGRMLRFLGGGHTLIGTDISYDMLTAARRHGLPSGVTIIQTDGTAIPLANESVDVIIACGVLKYTLFPSGFRCLAGAPAFVVRNTSCGSGATVPFSVENPACWEIAREMYRILKPNGRVIQIETYMNFQPEVFFEAFQKTGFVEEQARVLRRYEGRLERGLQSFLPSFFRPAWIILAGRIGAELRYWFDDPKRIGGGFKDYCFLWRKPPISE